MIMLCLFKLVLACYYTCVLITIATIFSYGLRTAEVTTLHSLVQCLVDKRYFASVSTPVSSCFI